VRAASFAILPALLQITACGGLSAPQRPEIQEQSTALRAPESPYRTVVPGDTLYSIAWENGRDYRELARWNQIPAPYIIKPGQQLRVAPPGGKRNTTKASKRSDSAVREKLPEPDTIDRNEGSAQAATIPTQKPVSKPSGSNARQKADRPAPHGNAGSARTKSPSPSGKSVATTSGRQSTSGRWTWPTDGKLMNQYGKSDSKGLDISGTRGEPVRAAADGRVVYQGSGLRGYGQLIIIKHNDEFLSAYAHNDRIHVKEGEAVKRGQKIADMGSTGTDRVKLHFEIRRHGAPVDPLKYLPRR